MSYSDIEICNLALSMMGAASIRSFEEANKRSRLMKRLYKFSRNQILQRIPWSFANGFVELVDLDLDTDETPFNMMGYQLPADCLTPLGLDPIDSKINWEVHGKILYTNHTPVSLFYTKEELNTSKYSIDFVNVLSAYLSYRAAPAISKDPKLTRDLKEAYLLAIQESYPTEGAIGSRYKSRDNDANLDSFVTGEDPGVYVSDSKSRFLQEE